MFMIWGGMQLVDTPRIPDSVIIRNNSIIRQIRMPIHEVYKTHWRNDPEIQRRYWAASFLLPTGTIIVLVLVVLLMVLFKRCPQMVAAILASLLGIIVIFATLVSLNHAPIYT